MLLQLLVACCLVAAACAAPRASHGTAPYEFAYAVKDDYTGNDFAHEEKSESPGGVSGSYRVLLPDGRTQVVTFNDAHGSGFIADVQYEGHAAPYQPPASSYN